MSFLRAVILGVLLTGILSVQAATACPLPPETGSKEIFAKFYNMINVLIQTKQWTQLNKYIHPEYGFYVYDNPGVRPVATNYFRIDDLIDNDGKRNEIIANKIMQLQADQKQKLKNGKVPYWDCGTDRWSKKGSFCQDMASDPVLPEHVLFSLSGDENPKHPSVVKAKQFSRFIKKHVLQTNGYDIHFAFINGKWYIAVIDVCDKCSA